MQRSSAVALDARRRLAAALAAVGCALAVGACGSSSQSGRGSGAQAAGIRFSDCMRSHGVPNFPDPAPGGGGFKIPVGSGINPQSPAFQSAQTACAKLVPGGPPPRVASQAQRLEMLKLARCMRRHGLPTFPDPTGTAPPPGIGFGIAFGAPGSFIAVPSAMLQTPAFNQAAAACGFPGARGHAKAAQGPG